MADNKNNLRNSLADAVIAVNKKNDANTDKIVGKMGELDAKKEKRMNDKQSGKKAHSKAFLDKLGDVEKAIKNQEVAESVNIKNPEAITGDLKKGLQGIIEALQKELKNFDKNIVVKNDFSNFASLFKSSQDKKSIIEALKKIEDKLLPNIEIVDYTLILSDIAKAVEDKEGVNILKDILAKEYSVVFPSVMPIDLDPNLIENDRVKVKLPKEQVTNILATASANNRPILDGMTDGNQKTQIVDESGNTIGSSQDANGDYHLDTALIQKIISSSGNSTTANLASGATFTGTAEETFGINGIQLYSFADQDTTVYIDQSLDATNWDVVDSFTCLANVACTRTFASVAPYYRARLTNNGDSTTTEVRFATGMTPVITTLPRALTDDDRLKSESTLSGKENSDRHVWVSPTNTLGINETVRLVGTNFDGTTKDPNFWTETVTNGGSVVQNGEIKLQTNTTANGTAQYDSVSRARFVVGSAMMFIGAFKFNDTVTEADNLRRVGAYDDDNGFFFQLDGGVFSVGSRSATSDTLVNSGSFNGNYGPNFTLNPARYYKLDIEYTPLGALYYINGVLLHKSVGGHLTRVLTLPIRFENNNDNNNATAVVMDCLGVVISRLGKLETSATYKYISGAASTLCKVGAGDLHSIVVTNNAGTISVYDGVSAGGTLISLIDGLKVQGTLSYNAPFSDGLFIVTTGSAILTVTYE